MVKALFLTLALALAGCTTSGTADTTPAKTYREIWCDNNVPRRDARPDSPRAEIDEINAHNRKGALWCGWTA